MFRCNGQPGDLESKASALDKLRQGASSGHLEGDIRRGLGAAPTV